MSLIWVARKCRGDTCSGGDLVCHAPRLRGYEADRTGAADTQDYKDCASADVEQDERCHHDAQDRHHGWKCKLAHCGRRRLVSRWHDGLTGQRAPSQLLADVPFSQAHQQDGIEDDPSDA